MENEELDFRTPEFWEHRYRTGKTGWDLGRPAPPLVSFVRGNRERLPAGKAVVLGCGRGHDARFLAWEGWEVLGVDVSALAVQEAERLAQAEGLSRVRFLRADLFALPEEWAGAFDLALEHTCFCAIDPARREEYARAVATLLRPGGAFLGLFFTVLPEDGPPFPTSQEELEALFSRYFTVEEAYTPLDSHPERRGRELLMLFRRRGSLVGGAVSERG
ncbi:MAG: SAM-dependent methyltransferase [Candidatus Poribacteria bacterium]|nr:MAG: SAM-dependent methyltransferase [Candidatus Poribacteria bacterium]